LKELNDKDDDDMMEHDREDNFQDELEPSVAESDTAIVDAVAAEVDEEDNIPSLTRAEVNLGRFAVTKVSLNSLILQSDANL
jgi:hypothetical protein